MYNLELEEVLNGDPEMPGRWTLLLKTTVANSRLASSNRSRNVTAYAIPVLGLTAAEASVDPEVM